MLSNNPPNAPPGLTAEVYGDSVTLAWQPATDTETPSMGLSYNLRIGTAPGGHDADAHDSFLLPR